jgi:serine/threonine protein kinase
LTVLTGTGEYIAPEVFHHKYSDKCDIWSIGIICYGLLTGKSPFSGKLEEIAEQQKKGVLFPAEDWD